MIDFQVDQEEDILSWTIDAEFKSDEGLHPIVVRYELPDNDPVFVNTEFEWDLILVFRKQTLDHTAPYFLEDGNLPSRIEMEPGDTISLDSGNPSEDTVDLEFSVVAEKPNWRDFITVDIDDQSHSIKINIAPTSADHIGLYALKVELTDNGSDSKDGPSEDYLVLPMTRTYKISLIINSEATLEQEEEENEDDLGGQVEKVTSCYMPEGIKTCNPVVQLEKVSFDGKVLLSFSHPMAIPEDYQTWGGSNSFLSQDSTTGPLQLAVTPGEE
mmetsp:Transcript_8253/g.12635  ORF Transcript_8253/g.12635 Transcript_8253/m.12635 type:complete len:271 (-) Transcript_8253:2382-3194(-)